MTKLSPLVLVSMSFFLFVLTCAFHGNDEWGWLYIFLMRNKYVNE